jgi:hypothetical protein
MSTQPEGKSIKILFHVINHDVVVIVQVLFAVQLKLAVEGISDENGLLIIILAANFPSFRCFDSFFEINLTLNNVHGEINMLEEFIDFFLRLTICLVKSIALNNFE